MTITVAVVCASLAVSAVAIVRASGSGAAAKLALCAIRQNDIYAVRRKTYLLAHPALEQVLGFSRKEDIRALVDLHAQLAVSAGAGCGTPKQKGTP
jgi:hypothetical protein